MALVNSDLFLVQDSVTKSNYKVNFQNLIDQIDTDINLDGRVAVAGDNMTGNLTLGTDNITLNASDGSITAAGRVDFADSTFIGSKSTDVLAIGNGSGRVEFSAEDWGSGNSSSLVISPANGTAPGFVFADDGLYIGGTLPSAPNITLNANGSATFAGSVKSTNGSGSAFLGATSGTGLAINNSSNATVVEVNYDGSITAAGELQVRNGYDVDLGTTINAGGINFRDDAGNGGLQCFKGGTGVAEQTINIQSDGSITAAGKLTVNNQSEFYRPTSAGGDGPNNTLLSLKSDVNSVKNLVAEITCDGSFNTDGSITASGALEAASIDGGTF